MDGMPSETVQYIKDALKEQGILTPNVLAYALATAKGEAGGKPVREIDGPQQAARLGYSGGSDYYGRGYIQLTHDYNYRDIGNKIGVDLVNNPDMALDPKIAAKVLAVFFKEKGIAAKAEAGDFVGARRGVNPDARGQEIAGIAKNYLGKVNTIMGLPSNVNMKDYDWNTQMKTLDGKQWILNNRTGAYDEMKNIGKTTPTPTLGMANTGKSGGTQAIRNPQTGKLEIIKKPNQEGGVLNFFKNLLSNGGNLMPQAYADSGLYKFQPRQMQQTFQPNMYTVQPGDTLSGIAGKYLGNPHMYPQISGYASGNPNVIRPGEQLNLGTKTAGGPGSPYPNMSNGTYNPHMYPVQQQATQQQAQNFQPSPQTTSQPSAQLSWKPPQQDKISTYLAQNPTRINNAPIPKPTTNNSPTLLPKNSLNLYGWSTANAVRNY